MSGRLSLVTFLTSIMTSAILAGIAATTHAGPNVPIFPTPHARAAYQVCLETGAFVELGSIVKAQEASPFDPLRACAKLLKSVGFRAEVKWLSLKAFKALPHPVIILDENKAPVVAKAGKLGYSLIDYPRAPRPGRAAAWPTDAVVVSSLPKEPASKSPVRPQPSVGDFGIIEENQTATKYFTVVNTSDKPVTVTRMFSTCPCTTVTGPKGKIPPGGKVTITVKFEPKGQWGYRRSMCIIKTDRGSATFKLTGYVRSPGGFFPGLLDFGTLVAGGKPAQRTVEFLGQTFSRRRPIVDIVSGAPLSWKLDKTFNANWSVPADKVQVTFDPNNLPLGPFRARLRVRFWWKGRIRETMVVAAARIVATRTQYHLFSVRNAVAGKAVKRRFVVRGVEAARVSKLTTLTAPAPLTARIAKTDDGTFAVALTSAPLKPGVAEAAVQCIVQTPDGPTTHVMYFVVNAAPAAATARKPHDYRELTRRLLGRRGSLSEGSIRFRGYKFKTPRKQYDAFAKLLASDPPRKGAEDIRAAAHRFAKETHVTRDQAFEGSWFFTADRDRWRMTFNSIKDYAPKGAGAPWDMEFNGDYVTVLTGDRYLRYQLGSAGPRLTEIDATFGRWKSIAAGSGVRGTKISTAARGTVALLRFSAKRGGKGSLMEYGFDRALGYAPRWSRESANGKLATEVIYAYGPDTHDGPVTPRVACHAYTLRGDMVRITLWVVDEWKRQVAEDDLHVKSPVAVEITDSRFGEADLVRLRNRLIKAKPTPKPDR